MDDSTVPMVDPCGSAGGSVPGKFRDLAIVSGSAMSSRTAGTAGALTVRPTVNLPLPPFSAAPVFTTAMSGPPLVSTNAGWIPPLPALAPVGMGLCGDASVTVPLSF